MTAFWRDGMDAPLPAPKGPVQEIKWEESRMLPGQSNTTLTPKRSIVVTYNAEGHEVKRVDDDLFYHSKSTVTTAWDGDRILSRLSEDAPLDSQAQKGTTRKRWDRWTYDSAGHLVELQRGSGANLGNHYLNFAYDDQGRVLRWERREGGADRPAGHTEVNYKGNSVETSEFNAGGREVSLQVQVLNEAGRVVDLEFSDSSKGELKLWYHSRFKYDDKGRVIEQDTDPYDFDAGSDYAPLPGKLVAQYDDSQHTVDQKFYEPEGKLVIHAIGQLDRDGFLIAYRVFDRSNTEGPGSDFVLNPKTGKLQIQKGNVAWEVTYDDFGNWTERKRWFSPADGGPRILVSRVTQTVTYRRTSEQ